MYSSRYGGMGTAGLGGYGMSSMGMGMGGGYGSYGGYGGYSMGGMGMGGMNNMYGGMGMGMGMGMGSPTGMMGSSSYHRAGGPQQAVDANGNPLLAITDGGAGVSSQPTTDRKQLEAQRKAQVAEHKRQRKMFVIEATMQIVTGALQVLMQLVMGVRDFAGILISVYYSYHALRSFRHSITGHGNEMVATGFTDAMGQPTYAMSPAAAVGGAVSGGSTAGSSAMRTLKAILGAAAIYSLGQAAVRAYSTARANQQARAEEERRLRRIREARLQRKRAMRRAERKQLRVGAENADTAGLHASDSEYESSMCSSVGSSSLGSDEDEEYSLGASEPRGRIRLHRSENDGLVDDGVTDATNKKRNIYVALYDHDATGQGGEFISFRAGDQFEIDEYSDNAWCDAVRLGGDGRQGEGRILIPGNYLKPLVLQQKI